MGELIDINIFLRDIFEQAQTQNNDYWVKKLLHIHFNRAHLAIMVEPYRSLLLEGEKTMESRFSQKMIHPFHRVSKGDIIILKKSGGDIVGVFEAKDVHYFELKSEQDVEAIKNEYNQQICCPDEFWDSKMNSRYATLIDVGHLMKLAPIRVSFPNRRSWISGEEVQHDPAIPSMCRKGPSSSGPQ